nr:SEL1-like repeat protein [uncultured Duganella sp.]
MLKPVIGVALILVLTSAGAQTETDAGPVVKITGTKPTPTGETPRVFAAKQSALRGTLAFKCGMDSAYFSEYDETDMMVQQMEVAQIPGEIGEPMAAAPIAYSRRFSGSAPLGDVSNMQESSSIPGVGTTSNLGPCNDNDRKVASAREYIIRKDKSFDAALTALDAKDYQQAAALLLSAYDKIGYPEAAVLLAKLSLNGLGMPRNAKDALDWLDKATMVRYDQGRETLRFNPKTPEALNGRIEAALLLAKLNLDGTDGLKKDPKAARKWYVNAAEWGYVPALNMLGLASRDGSLGAKNIKQALDYFKEAAEAGYAPAQFNLAALYAVGGDGMPQDQALARAWYAQAGQSGHARALYTLGRIYDLGEGTPADQAKAIVYYKAAALKSDPDALHALALYFYEGDQVAKNLDTARKLLTEAAMRGQREAMFNLAVMLSSGEGGPKDLGMAYVWFSLAKTSGHQRAGQALAELDKEMSPQDHATADAILKPRKSGG